MWPLTHALNSHREKMRDKKWLSSMLDADWKRNTSRVRKGSMPWEDMVSV